MLNEGSVILIASLPVIDGALYMRLPGSLRFGACVHDMDSCYGQL